MTPLQFTRNVRSLNRLRLIAQVLTQHGFGYVVTRANLSRFVPVWMLRKSRRRLPINEPVSSIGRRIRLACTELGPTFIKFAQLLTTRPDIVPVDVLAELKKLQDDVPAFDTTLAMKEIEQSLGKPLGECFEWIDDTPFASGSIGQVYHARSLSGTPLVVKVRRPDIENIIDTDMQLLNWFAETIETLMPELAIYRPKLLALDLEQFLKRELDYISEASATAQFEKAFADDVGIRIPHVYWELSTNNVLTFQAIGGTNIGNILTGQTNVTDEYDRPLIARRLADCFLKQFFEVGLFHSDPHPGNILISPPATIGLVDFGQVGTLSDELMEQIVVMVYAGLSREIDLVVDTLADLGTLSPNTDTRQLAQALQQLIDKYYGLPIKRIDLSSLVSEFSEIVRQHHITLPRNALMAFKADSMLATITAQLDPNFNPLEPMKQRIAAVIRKRLAPPKLARGATVWGWHLLSAFRHAPRHLRQGLRQFASQGWRMRVSLENIDRLADELDRASNRLAFSIVIAAIIVGSSVVVSADSSLTVFDIKFQYLGIIGYVIAGVLGLGLTWAIFRSGRLH